MEHAIRVVEVPILPTRHALASAHSTHSTHSTTSKCSGTHLQGQGNGSEGLQAQEIVRYGADVGVVGTVQERRDVVVGIFEPCAALLELCQPCGFKSADLHMGLATSTPVTHPSHTTTNNTVRASGCSYRLREVSEGSFRRQVELV